MPGIPRKACFLGEADTQVVLERHRTMPWGRSPEGRGITPRVGEQEGGWPRPAEPASSLGVLIPDMSRTAAPWCDNINRLNTAELSFKKKKINKDNRPESNHLETLDKCRLITILGNDRLGTLPKCPSPECPGKTEELF